jgi:DNA-binding phage protein
LGSAPAPLREALKDGDPRLSTLLGVAKALGLKIQVAA